jgi:hypothetical protein
LAASFSNQLVLGLFFAVFDFLLIGKNLLIKCRLLNKPLDFFLADWTVLAPFHRFFNGLVPFELRNGPLVLSPHSDRAALFGICTGGPVFGLGFHQHSVRTPPRE